MEIIIYGSEYGNAKKYAEELSARTGITMVSYKEVTNPDDYDTIIYIGSLYAGGILGMKKTFAGWKDSRGKRIIIATVGLADPLSKKNTDHIKEEMKKQLAEGVYNNATVFHLRGGIDYSKLSFKHRAMMRFVYNKAKKEPENAETKALIETYNKEVDFIDFDSLQPVIECIKE